MVRPLRGERYAKDPRASKSFPDFLVHKLPFLDYGEAMAFYAEWIPKLSPPDVSLLGCNDRFFLLTGLCNRVDMFHPWLYERAREVEAEPDGYLDLWARWHYKSTIITFGGCIQEILCDPEITIGIFSNNLKISRPFLAQIKEEFEVNDALKAYYPDVLWQNPKKEAPKWSLQEGIIVKRKGNPKEATVEAHGLIDGMPTGRHFKLLVYDDIINEKNVTNPDQIRKATERVELSDNLGSGESTRKWFIGTRYHFGDSYAHLIEHNIVKTRIYPATDDGTLNGNPVFMSPAAWEERKKTQRSTIAAQMLQNPIAGKENTFFTKWLRPFFIRPSMMNVYIMGDPSLGRTKTSDRTAIAVVGIDSAGNKYLLDGYCHRMQLSERWRHLRDLWLKWSRQPGVQLVKVGWERYGLMADHEHFEHEMRREGIRFEISELNWARDSADQSKSHRIQRLEPDFRNEKFFVPWKVWHPAVAPMRDEIEPGEEIPLGPGVARWWIEEGNDEIHYGPIQGLHRLERSCRLAGELWRIMDPIRRIDEDGNIYDLTRVFFEEFRFHPFSPRDDLIDVVSRIYDMDPTPAVKNETVHVEDYVDS